MVWQDFFVAVALLLVFEGMMPFVNPDKWREFMQRVTKQPDKSLRVIGLTSMLMGVGLLYAIR